MYNAMIVKICHSRECRAYEVCSVRFVVAAFTADAIEKFSPKSKIGDEIHLEAYISVTVSSSRIFCDRLTVIHGLKVVHQCKNVLMSHRHPLEHRNLIPNHMLSSSH